MDKIFFDSWLSLFRTLIIGITAYSGLIILLRVSGKRTLSKMNAFDLIVTIALGSTFATVLLNKSIPLVDGLLGFTLLIFLQFFIIWLSVRSEKVKSLVKADPSFLFYKGNFLEYTMKTERVTQEEILAAIRQTGTGLLEDVDAVVMETDGSLSVIGKIKESQSIVTSNVKKSDKNDQ